MRYFAHLLYFAPYKCRRARIVECEAGGYVRDYAYEREIPSTLYLSGGALLSPLLHLPAAAERATTLDELATLLCPSSALSSHEPLYLYQVEGVNLSTGTLHEGWHLQQLM